LIAAPFRGFFAPVDNPSNIIEVDAGLGEWLDAPK
jgi:hypothetical protein